MGKVAPSVVAREQLNELLAGGASRETNVISTLVGLVTRLVVQELVEGEQGTSWAGGVVMSAVARLRSVLATVMSRAGSAPRRAASTLRCRRSGVLGCRSGRA